MNSKRGEERNRGEANKLRFNFCNKRMHANITLQNKRKLNFDLYFVCFPYLHINVAKT